MVWIKSVAALSPDTTFFLPHIRPLVLRTLYDFGDRKLLNISKTTKLESRIYHTFKAGPHLLFLIWF
jgi:hypothetical protein